MKIGFIGAGRVGFTLGKYFADHGQALTGYYSRHTEHAEMAAQFTQSVCYENLELLVRDSDAIFITVVDGQIPTVFLKLKEYDVKGKFICHCSGAMTAAEAFPGIAKTGAMGYSIHPLFSINDCYQSYIELADAFFCLEGDAANMDTWLNCLTSMNLRCRSIEAGQKKRYHAAASIASNLLVGVLWESQKLMMECGFGEKEAMEALTPLATGSLKHVLEDGAVMALTGPLERGDTDTVQKHMDCLNTNEEKQFYRAVSTILLECAMKKNPDRDYTEMTQLIKGEEV